MKRYRVDIISRYLDGGSESETVYVWAYSAEHAEEIVWDRCGGASGACAGMEFKATRLK